MRSASICREPRLRRALAAVAIAAAVVAWPGPGATQTADGRSGQAPAPHPGTFRSRTDLVALQVAVVDHAGRPVPDLHLTDFAVFEDGVRQTVTLFATSSAPLDVMLLLDVSGSMRDRMPAAQEAAIDLVHTLRPDDRAALVVFSDHVRIAQPLTANQAVLESAIRQASPSGGTALHEAAYIALRELARVQRTAAEIRRQALIVLTDGEDTTSRNVTQHDVLDVARRGAVTIFTIMPAPEVEIDPEQRMARGGPGAEFNLRTLARETGGRAFRPSRRDDLSSVYSQIAEELSQQYWLAYVAPPGGGGFRRVSVQIVMHPGLHARTRGGYFAAAPRHSAAEAPARPAVRP